MSKYQKTHFSENPKKGAGALLIYRKFGGKDIRLAKRTNHFLENGKIGPGGFLASGGCAIY